MGAGDLRYAVLAGVMAASASCFGCGGRRPRDSANWKGRKMGLDSSLWAHSSELLEGGEGLVDVRALFLGQGGC